MPTRFGPSHVARMPARTRHADQNQDTRTGQSGQNRSMHVEFRMTPGDHVQCNAHILETSEIFQAVASRQRASAAVVTGVIGAQTAGLVFRTWSGALVGLIVASVLIWVCGPRIVKRERHRNVQRIIAADDGIGDKDDVCLTVDDIGLHTRRDGRSSSFSWDTVVEVETATEFFFIWVSAGEAIPVPRRAVGAAELVDEARSRLSSRRA